MSRCAVQARGASLDSEGVGVSIATVDRALRARPGISEATYARIMKAAAALGYRPNLAARHLKLGRQPRILVHLAREIASYFDALRQGIQQTAARLQPPLKVDFRSYPRMGQGEIESLQTALENAGDGIILTPGSPSRIGSADPAGYRGRYFRGVCGNGRAGQ